MSNLSEKQKKWFYPNQKDVLNELSKRFETISCNFQMFSEDRIIECFNGINPGKETILIEVHYRNLEHSVSVLIYDLSFKQGWQMPIKKIN